MEEQGNSSYRLTPLRGSITGWGESGKAILQVSIADFFGHCQNIFWAKMAQPPRKIGPYAYGF